MTTLLWRCLPRFATACEALLPALLPVSGFEQRRDGCRASPKGKRISTAEGGVTVRGKAPNGAGSVYPIADGSWRASWTDRSGRRRSVRGRTCAQAVSRRDAAQAADDEATDAARRVPKRFSPRTPTVSDVAEWWLDQQRHRVRPSSLGKYADRVNRFNAVLGPELVSALTAEQVASWASSLPTSRSA
jgi:hypothetical protein